MILSQFNYQVDATGRRTNATEIIKQESSGWQTNTLSWAYDAMYRLTNEVCVSSVSGKSYTNSYQYDKAGNRWQRITYAGGSVATFTNQYNANDQLIREVAFTNGVVQRTNSYGYDANGSLIAKTNHIGSSFTNVYGYDLKNKLSSMTTLGSGITNTYRYNDQGIRVQSVTSGGTKHFLVDANNHTGYAQVLEELNTVGGTATMSYVLGDDVIAQATSTASYLLYDGHGSTRQLANSSGTVSSRYNYDAYGETLSTSSTTAENAATSLLYCGEQYDTNLKMYNLRARFYDPSNGRFNAMDSFMGANEDPQSLHKYAYCYGDPVNGTDPSGFSTTITETTATIGIILFLAARVIDVSITQNATAKGMFALQQISKNLNVPITKGPPPDDDARYKYFFHGTSTTGLNSTRQPSHAGCQTKTLWRLEKLLGYERFM